MPVGKVVILNGVSSSGKSSLAFEIQRISRVPFLRCSLDAFWDMTPANIPAGSHSFPRMKEAMAKSVAALALTDCNVVVDVILRGRGDCDAFLAHLNAIDLMLVKVKCNREELARREIARGDRKHGLALSQLATTHQGVDYNLIVDTASTSPHMGAQSILASLNA
ncbi:MAG: hypothetical protein ABJ205_09015 [Erythrobacter sp.]|uniref:phosphotransferase-like protein n=1 Tax=Erythrobacter sp. TaxID=1042 RepID=UPI00326460E6